ncbi:MAG TPA: alpha-L-arabinofuranosidase C-terminal domain-containing protein [Ohtaekwangia sp.]|uniref:alpha-L-arabinofuranosidase C-terminal domain-containing protein n=1 Tax=Ohtaekwangia sp. TaxID=2066019 RepID=UPI002F9578A5
MRILQFCRRSFLLVAAILVYQQSEAQSIALTVDAGKPGAPIQSTMWGIFFEDINFAADGGIYAELVKNRSFEFDEPLMGWEDASQGGAKGAVLITNESATRPANPRYAHIAWNAEQGLYTLINEGFKGMGIRKDIRYNFSVWARTPNEAVKLKIELLNANGTAIGGTTLSVAGNDWKKYTASFTATATEAKAKLRITFEGKGAVDADMISLFPNDTWKNRPGGLRADLVQWLADLKPGFIRFPGGCIVEGRDLTNRYQWKKTVGNVEDRELIINRWNTEFKHRSAPDYFQSFGLGFFEYFQLAEDIGAEPLPIINCGMACQFNSSEVVPLDQLDPYLQDALDLIEFANGSTDTQWGKLRASMGHPAPFNMKMMGVGNEQWGEQYIDRLKVFTKVLKEKHPEIKLITSVGPFSGGELFDYLNPELRSMHVDFIDEHYYRAPEWFLKNANRYDKYDRSGPKIFAGEYAGHTERKVQPENKNNWESALAEAAFMTGLERNADIVYMASYAPLFAHVEGWQWTPDLIWFDNLRSFGTPNYYVQKLFSTNKGTNILSVTSANEALSGKNGLYASAVLDGTTKEVIIKVVNTNEKETAVDILVSGAKKASAAGILSVLKSAGAEDINTLDDPFHIKPVEQSISLKGKKLQTVLPAASVSVIRLKAL